MEELVKYLNEKVDDLELENEILILKLKDERYKLKRIKQYILSKATYVVNPTIEDIKGVFSPEEIKFIIKIIEGDE